MEPCISTQVPDDADLILLEYTVNDVADEVFRARLEAQRNLPTSCKNGFDHPARYGFPTLPPSYPLDAWGLILGWYPYITSHHKYRL